MYFCYLHTYMARYGCEITVALMLERERVRCNMYMGTFKSNDRLYVETLQKKTAIKLIFHVTSSVTFTHFLTLFNKILLK